MQSGMGAAVAAWLLASTFYFFQYTLRSSPGVMVPQLAAALGLTPSAVASLLGAFYYGYAGFSLIAGALLDRFGTRLILPSGALITGVGCLLFATGNPALAEWGRFLQGAGGVFALIGALYIVGKAFPADKGATMTGTTQMFGSTGASAGQFLIGPLIAAGVAVNSFWMAMGSTGIALGAALFFLLPKSEPVPRSENWIGSAIHALVSVLKNPQSWLCGLIAGLMFIPTTILDMIWGVKYLQEAYGFDYGSAVVRSATVPVGWLIGCPLWGTVSDRIGRRRPVILASASLLTICVAWILYGPSSLLPPYVAGLVTGVASAGAMLTYTVIREANSPKFGGTATGVVSFLNFGISAILGPVFSQLMEKISGRTADPLERYQMAFQPLLYGLGIAIVLTLFFLKETGREARTTS